MRLCGWGVGVVEITPSYCVVGCLPRLFHFSLLYYPLSPGCQGDLKPFQFSFSKETVSHQGERLSGWGRERLLKSLSALFLVDRFSPQPYLLGTWSLLFLNFLRSESEKLLPLVRCSVCRRKVPVFSTVPLTAASLLALSTYCFFSSLFSSVFGHKKEGL